ncbi:MAG: glycosyltransferase family 2 protein [Myxococcota bacterium]
MGAPATSLSVVVPAFDEATCIESTLRALARHLGAHHPASEIVVVDDGSRDDTAARARAAAAALPVPVRVLAYAGNRGKGHALKVGFAAARGARVLFTDADLSTPLDAMDALLARLDDGADVAIGSRKREGAHVEVHQPWWRESMGRVFTALVRLLVAPVSDATCGFKAFRGDAGRALFAALRIDDWSFDAELLFLAARRGLRVDEVPVTWRDQPGTKVRVVRDAAMSLLGLARIRWNALRSRYDAPAPSDARIEAFENDAARAAR